MRCGLSQTPSGLHLTQLAPHPPHAVRSELGIDKIDYVVLAVIRPADTAPDSDAAARMLEPVWPVGVLV